MVADWVFSNCPSLNYVDLSSCLNLGGTVAYDHVFAGISGNSLDLYIPSVIMTCNLGGPDGDVQHLQENNTVIIHAI
jgi:hypothetical protein